MFPARAYYSFVSKQRVRGLDEFVLDGFAVIFGRFGVAVRPD